MISIVIPTFNSDKFIDQTLDSIVNQTTKNFELILIDDGSEDHTVKKINQFIVDHPEIRCIIIEQENHGPSSARNRGMKEARGEYIQFFDSDDIMHPQKLELSLNAIKSNPEAGAIITDFKRFKGKSLDLSFERINKQYFLEHSKVVDKLVIKQGIGCPRIIYKRNWLENIGGFNEKLRNNEDHELNFRLLCAECKFIYFPTILMYYRQHNSEFRVTRSKQRFHESINASKIISGQIENLRNKELHRFARISVANKIAYSGVCLIRIGKFVEGKKAIKFAKSINQNISTTNKKWLSFLNRILGVGTIDFIPGLYNKIFLDN